MDVCGIETGRAADIPGARSSRHRITLRVDECPCSESYHINAASRHNPFYLKSSAAKFLVPSFVISSRDWVVNGVGKSTCYQSNTEMEVVVRSYLSPEVSTPGQRRGEIVCLLARGVLRHRQTLLSNSETSPTDRLSFFLRSRSLDTPVDAPTLNPGENACL